MPNGGSDNCGRCPFNRATINKKDYSEVGNSSFCTIRNLPIKTPLWTYCWNRRSRSEKPKGPVYTQGIYENGYCRIPWNGEHEPRTYVAGQCEVCGRIFEEQGIEVFDNKLTIQFCCNAHFIQWWKDKHRGAILPYEYKFEDPDAAKRTNLHGIYTELYRKGRIHDFIHYGKDIQLVENPEIFYIDKFVGCLMGLGIGDALGHLVEGLSPGEFEHIKDFSQAYSPKEEPKGKISDDTQMTLMLGYSLVQNKGLDPKDLANNFVSQRLRGIGKATLDFIINYKDRKINWDEAGVKSAGNGAAMRVAPIGLLYNNSFEDLKLASGIQTIVTHNDRTAIASSIVMALAVAKLTHMSPTKDLKNQKDIIAFCELLSDAIEDIDEKLMTRRDNTETSLYERIRFELPKLIITDPMIINNHWWSGAFVLESLPFALYCFLRSPDDFMATLLTAVNFSKDSDTVASMACAMSGAFNGKKAVPRHLLEELEYKDILNTLAKELFKIKIKHGNKNELN